MRFTLVTLLPVLFISQIDYHFHWGITFLHWNFPGLKLGGKNWFWRTTQWQDFGKLNHPICSNTANLSPWRNWVRPSSFMTFFQPTNLYKGGPNPLLNNRSVRSWERAKGLEANDSMVQSDACKLATSFLENNAWWLQPFGPLWLSVTGGMEERDSLGRISANWKRRWNAVTRLQKTAADGSLMSSYQPGFSANCQAWLSDWWDYLLKNADTDTNISGQLYSL